MMARRLVGDKNKAVCSIIKKGYQLEYVSPQKIDEYKAKGWREVTKEDLKKES